MFKNIKTKEELQAEALKQLKQQQIAKIKQDCTAMHQVKLEVDFIDGTVKEVTFNGGDPSAIAINKAVELASNLEETSMTLWDIDNKNHHGISLDEALEISATIGKKYREDMIKRQDLITAINEATTKEEIKAIEW